MKSEDYLFMDCTVKVSKCSDFCPIQFSTKTQKDSWAKETTKLIKRILVY